MRCARAAPAIDAEQRAVEERIAAAAVPAQVRERAVADGIERINEVVLLVNAWAAHRRSVFRSALS